MKKRIGLGIITTLMIVGVVVFANSHTTKQADICPDRPGCICSKHTTEQVAKPTAKAEEKDICPNKPGCVCNK